MKNSLVAVLLGSGFGVLIVVSKWKESGTIRIAAFVIFFGVRRLVAAFHSKGKSYKVPVSIDTLSSEGKNLEQHSRASSNNTEARNGEKVRD